MLSDGDGWSVEIVMVNKKYSGFPIRMSWGWEKKVYLWSREDGQGSNVFRKEPSFSECQKMLEVRKEKVYDFFKKVNYTPE